MKKVLFVSLLIVGAMGIARADSDDRPGRDWMSISAVTQKLQDLGYKDITEIEADDGLWKAKGYKEGEYFKVKLDPHTGEVVSRHRKYGDRPHDDDHDDD